MQVEQLTGPETFHGEGPAYSPRWPGSGIRWVDMLAGDLLELRSDGSVGRAHLASILAGIRPRRQGGHIVAVAHGVALADDDALDAPLSVGPELWTDPNLRMNEVACDPAGAFYPGSTTYDHAPEVAALFRHDPDGATRVQLDRVTVSNGLEWTADGALAYYIDSETMRVDVFDWDPERGLHGRRAFVEFEAGPAGIGSPDGLTVDAEGGVWVAMFGASHIRRYDPSGRLSARVELPVSRITSLAFAGERLDRLVITTSRKGLSELPLEADAGALYELLPGVRGVAQHEFAG